MFFVCWAAVWFLSSSWEIKQKSFLSPLEILWCYLQELLKALVVQKITLLYSVVHYSSVKAITHCRVFLKPNSCRLLCILYLVPSQYARAVVVCLWCFSKWQAAVIPVLQLDFSCTEAKSTAWSRKGNLWQERDLCLCQLSECNSPEVSILANVFQGRDTILMRESLEMVFLRHYTRCLQKMYAFWESWLKSVGSKPEGLRFMM